MNLKLVSSKDLSVVHLDLRRWTLAHLVLNNEMR